MIWESQQYHWDVKLVRTYYMKAGVIILLLSELFKLLLGDLGACSLKYSVYFPWQLQTLQPNQNIKLRYYISPSSQQQISTTALATESYNTTGDKHTNNLYWFDLNQYINHIQFSEKTSKNFTILQGLKRTISIFVQYQTISLGLNSPLPCVRT